MKEFTNLHMFFGTQGMNVGVSRVRKMESLIYVVSGEIRVAEKSGMYDFLAREGELLYIPSGDATAIYAPSENKIMMIKFDGKLQMQAFCIKKDDNHEALSTADYMACQLEKHREKDDSFFAMLTYKLLCELKQYTQKSAPQKFHKLFPVIAELRAHPEVDKKILDYAKMCGMSEVGFRKLFMEYTGMTPVEYRTQLRLKMAADMLCDGEYSVTEAAARSGFNSISFFCREFKKFYGYSAGNIFQKS